MGIAGEIIEGHPDWQVESTEEMPQTSDLSTREKARLVIDRLIKSRWLEEPVRPDYQRMIYFDANGAVLLETLRKMARPDASVFSDSLSGVCAILANSAALAALAAGGSLHRGNEERRGGVAVNAKVRGTFHAPAT